MLGRTTYTLEEINSARFAVAAQLTAYATLSDEITGATSSETSGDTERAALADFEPLFVNNLVLALDRFFVHRVRAVSGRNGNPLNEVELIVESLMNNNAVLRGNTVVAYRPETSVVKLELGDDIRLTAAEFRDLSDAFFTELEARFLPDSAGDTADA